MVEFLESIPFCFSQIGPEKTRLQIQGTRPSARSLVTALLTSFLPGRTLVVTRDLREARRFVEELEFFLRSFRFAPQRQGEPPAASRILLIPAANDWTAGLSAAAAENVRERLKGLLALLDPEGPSIVVAPGDSVLEKVPPRGVLEENVRLLRPGDRMDRDELAAFLAGIGYRRVPVVESQGEMAVRGGLIDFFPLTSDLPCRVDFFGDSVETIRTFQPETQRTLKHVEFVRATPASLFLERAVPREDLRRRLKMRADLLDMPAGDRMAVLEKLETGIALQEAPLLLPFCYPAAETLLDYFDPRSLVVVVDPDGTERHLQALTEDVESSLGRLARSGRIPPRSEDLYLTIENLWSRLRDFSLVVFSDLPVFPVSASPAQRSARRSGEAAGAEPFRVVRIQCGRLSVQVPATPSDAMRGPALRGLALFAQSIRQWVAEGQRVFLVCGTEPERLRMSVLLEDHQLEFVQPSERIPFWEAPAGLYLLRGYFSEGFLVPAAGMVFLHEEDIFGRKVRRPKVVERSFFRGVDVRELRPGDFVVHVDFGIGRYVGLETLRIRDYVNDYLHLEYANGDRLYLPVDRASRIQRYVSTEDAPPALDRLGGGSWARTKQKVREAILAMASELVSLYAARAVKKGYAFSKPDASYQEFEATFPYEETPDQLRAIEEVCADMERDRPMDRLVCGDVGFGKTEVAIRAAWRAAMDGKQVAVLVPTTVLAQQHYGNFSRRFEGYPLRVEMLSRFRTGRQQKAILEGLARGQVDIVIGTHRLLQKDVVFRNLGLVIVDEEHRFGVRQKEALKKMRTEVDVLTLTATPIPRTLHMALLGIRDLSVIETPPQDRHAIETYIVPFDPDILRRAIERERARGGQVFFVHNQVYDIGAVADRIRQIMPEARIAIAHGQMPEKALEKVMLEFVQGDYDVLVCTTIIESGLDIPNANTLIVNRADRFGLAQLYQLRGRVGRSERQAYAYLIVPDEETMPGDARERLEALYEFTQLGSGFRIARHDLEIRGAGNILGASQSGHIRAVGYDLYLELMEKAVRELKGEEVVEEVDPEIYMDMPAFLPRDYIDDSTQRLSLYRRLAGAATDEEVDELCAEIEDRFGPLPGPARTLIDIIRIKVRLRRLRVREARSSEEGLLLAFDPLTPVPVSRVLEWAAREPERLRLYPDNRILVRFSTQTDEERLAAVRQVLAWLDPGAPAEGAGACKPKQSPIERRR